MTTVKVSSTDLLAEFLEDKLSAGSGIVVTKKSSGGAEYIEISAASLVSDVSLTDGYQVKVTSSDLLPDFLYNKLDAGDNVTLTTISNGGIETIRIDVADSDINDTIDTMNERWLQAVTERQDLRDAADAYGTHVADSTIHFTEASIDHTAISNIGTNSHAQIDTHITDVAATHVLATTERQNLRDAADGYLPFDGSKPMTGALDFPVGTSAAPSVTFGAADTGVHGLSTDGVIIATSGNERIRVGDSTVLFGSNTGPHIRLTGGTTTLPSISPSGLDTNTGISSSALAQLSFIAGGVEGVRITESTGGVINVDVNGTLNLRESTAPSATDGYGKLYVQNDGDLYYLDDAGTQTNLLSAAGGVSDHTLLTNIGTNTHAQVDTHIATSTTHFTEGSINHTAISNIGIYSHAILDEHVDDPTLHFTEASIDHTAISNVGTNTHTQIDTHITDATATHILATTERQNLRDAADGYLPYDGSKPMTGQLELIAGSAGTPSLHFSDSTTGIYRTSANNIGFTTLGTQRMRIAAEGIYINGTTGPFFRTSAGSATTPGITVSAGDANTGMGTAGADQLSLIAGGVEGARITETAGEIDLRVNGVVSLLESTAPTEVDGYGKLYVQEDGNLYFKNESGLQTNLTTAGGVTDHTALTSIGTNTHAQIDTHIADSTLHFTEASIDHDNITNPGNFLHSELDTLGSNFCGSLIETTDITVDASGANIEFSLQKMGGGDLTEVFNSGFITVDCTPAQTINLTEGTTTTPQINYVYVHSATATLSVSTSGWPITHHAPVATVLVLDRATTNTYGALKVHAYTDHLLSADGGHSSHIGKRIRAEQAIWQSGTAITTDPALSASGSTVDFTVSDGYILQMHAHEFPNCDGGVDGHIVVNDNTAAYSVTTDMATILIDADGGSLTGKYYSLVVWGVVSEKTEDTHIMVNMPTGSYNSLTNATRDADKYSVYTVPPTFAGVGFLISRVTIRNQSDTTFTVSAIEDLRGQNPSTTAGGGAGVTSHLDLTDIGTNTHAQVDTHIATSSTHFTEGSIDHTAITNVGTNTHTQVDTHIATSSTHFTEGSIDHTAITNVGVNTHAQLDTNLTLSTSERQDLRDAADGYLSVAGGTMTGALTLDSVTTSQRDALSAAEGMVLYNTTTESFEGYSDDGYGGQWGKMDQDFEAFDSTATPTGTVHTLDFTVGRNKVVDLASATGTVAMTLVGGVNGTVYTLKVIQGATARTLSWDANVLFPGGTALTISTTDNAVDVIQFLYDGTDYLAMFNQAFA